MSQAPGGETSETDQGLSIGWRSSVLRSFCEVPIDGSPYVSVELQTVEHNNTSRGVVVLRRREDLALEIHTDPALGLDGSWAQREPALLHQDVHSVNSTPLGDFVCQVSAGRVHASCNLTTLDGRDMVVAVAEEFEKESPPVFTPAPPGTLKENPRFLVMGVLRVLGRSSKIDISFGGDAVTPTHFSIGPVDLGINEARAGGDLVLGTLVARSESPELVLSGGGHHLEISPGVSSGEAFTVTSSVGSVATGVVQAGDDTIRIEGLDQDWNPGLRHPKLQALRLVRQARRKPVDIDLTLGSANETNGDS